MADAFLGPRETYARGALEPGDLAAEPHVQLRRWLDEAAAAGCLEPTAMNVATVGPDGQPSSRMVLLRILDARGLVFFTNYGSRKGHELAANPRAAACFWWGWMERQVRVEGRVERVDPAESDAYFASRPTDSRIASAASPQSEPVADRAELERRVAEAAARLGDDPDRPDGWGGYRLVPDRWEFWQGRPSRLHDRLVMTPSEQGWRIQRLAP